MALRLVIAEKPSVAQTIAAALGVKGKQDGYIEGGGYLISWCVGHLVQLAEAAAYGEQYRKWQLDSLPILPEEWQYAVDPDKGKQFATLKELMHRADVSEVINACDAGREGELIFRFVYEVAGCKKPMRRLWISSMEDGAIKAGFASLKDGREYDALFASALCRAKADWLIGINATRLFSCLYGKTLNVGRVQTPTLKMLTDRDAAISHFQKEKYYHVRLCLSGAEAASGRISDKAEADALKGACEAGKAVCVSVTREKKSAAPPKLFDLTALQKEANRIFGYTAKQTLDLAQALYEKRLLTYPRTDSSYLTDDMGGTAAGIIALLCEKLPFMAGADFTPDIAKVTDSKKVSDHHAIIPTMELAKADPDALPESERNIITLAGARLLFATAEPHIFEAVTAVFSCADTEFTARGKTVLSDGWKEIERRYRATLKQKPDPEDGEIEGVTLPELETVVSPNLASTTLKVTAGAVAAAGFAIACYSEWSSVLVSGMTAGMGSFVQYFILVPLGVGPVISIGILATIIGLTGGLLARRFLIPPLITAVAGITPLLPGLSIYRGMYALLHEQMVVGLSNMALALGIASGLAAGVVLGEWFARRLRRPPGFNHYRELWKLRRFSFQDHARDQSS